MEEGERIMAYTVSECVTYIKNKEFILFVKLFFPLESCKRIVLTVYNLSMCVCLLGICRISVNFNIFVVTVAFRSDFIFLV